MNQICISRLDKIGDMILTLPAIKAIKTANPNMHISVLASEYNSKVLQGINYIDKIIIVNTNSNFLTLLKRIIFIRKINFDFFLNVSPTILSYFFCFFSNSKIKATLIFLSRYKKSIYSKLFTRLFAKIFCNYVHVIDRCSKLKNNENLHQTNMIIEMIKICKISVDNNPIIEIVLPKKKLNLTPLNKTLITIHLSEKWINKFYTENNLLELFIQLPKEKYIYVLTTDNFNKNKFKKIYKNYLVIDNNNFSKINKLNNSITILDKLSYQNWVQIIYSSNLVITPECGCTHISSACKVPVIIIYDSNNLPDAIYKEYHPWKSQHKKLVFDDIKLNKKIINNLK